MIVHELMLDQIRIDRRTQRWMLIARRLVASFKLPQIVAFHARLEATTTTIDRSYSNWNAWPAAGPLPTPTPTLESLCCLFCLRPRLRVPLCPLCLAPLHTWLIITDKTRLICKTDNSIGDQWSLQVRPQRRRTPRTHALKNYVNSLALGARSLALNARGPR